MQLHQLQLTNIETTKKDGAVHTPKGTPTVGLIRKQRRPRNYGLMTVDCADEAELVDLACFLVARNQIIKTLVTALEWFDTIQGDRREPAPNGTILIRELRAAIFMATGQYAAGTGGVPPQGIDTWRRRNGMVPKYGHLTESEIRSHVKAMDEHAKRAYDPKEPFEAQLRRYVAQLQDDAKQWDAAEGRVMGSLLRELEAGYVLDRGETAHMVVGNAPAGTSISGLPPYDKKVSGWAGALVDAERKAENARRELEEWKYVARVCRERIDKKIPWPGKTRKMFQGATEMDEIMRQAHTNNDEAKLTTCQKLDAIDAIIEKAEGKKPEHLLAPDEKVVDEL